MTLPSTSRIQIIDFANSSPFDITYTGFGCPDQMIIEAGLKVRLHAEIYNSGNLTMFPVNNVGATSNGIVNITVYFVTDNVPPGTFPVAIPVQKVQANVPAVQTLSNEGQLAGTLVIDIGPSGNNQVISIYNDHFSWSVVQSGVAHTVLQGQSSGNPLLIGKSGDISEVLGNLTVDGTTTLTGDVTLGGNITLNTNNKFFKGKDQAGTIYQIAGYDGTTAKQLNLSDSTAGIILNILSNIQTAGTLALNTAGTNFPSGTAGSATLYQFMVGTLKLVLVILNGWEKTTAGDSVVTLPTAFTNWATVIASDTGPFHLNNSSGTNLNIFSMTSWPTTAGNNGGTGSTSQGNSNTMNFLVNPSPLAQVGLFGSQAATARNGLIFIIGV